MGKKKIGNKQLKVKLNSALQKWFFHSEAFVKALDTKQDQANSTETIEPGFYQEAGENVQIQTYFERFETRY